MIGILLCLMGFQVGEPPAETHPLIGTWVVDWERSLPGLDQKLEKLDDSAAEKKEIRDEILDNHQGYCLIFTKDSYRKRQDGKRVRNDPRVKRWNVLEHDKRTWLHNETFLLRLFDDANTPELNKLSLEEINEQIGSPQGVAPYCVAFELLDRNHLRSFNLKVRDHEITRDRDYSWIVFRRAEGP